MSDYLDILKKYLKNEKRIIHSLSVAEEIVKFAEIYDIDKEKAYFSALFHDIGHDLESETLIKYSNLYGHNPDIYEKRYPYLLHAYASCYIIKKEKLPHDKEILSAIEKHTIADVNMSMLDKLLYVMDFAEPKRNFPEAKVAYNLLKEDLDKAFYYVLKETILFLIKKDVVVHPKSVILLDKLIMEGKIYE